MAQPIFTLAEARATLPQVEGLLRAIQRGQRQLTETQALIEAVRRSAGGDGTSLRSDTGQLQRRAREAVETMRRQVEEVQALGVQIKDIDRGLVDWTAIRDEHPVLLCWQLGETTIAWWHEIAEGFAGRRPIVAEEWD